MKNRVLDVNDHADIAEERRKATFDTDKMAAAIWETKEALERRRGISKAVAERPFLLDTKNPVYMSRAERVDNAARKTVLMLSHINELCDPTHPADLFHLTNEVIGIEGHPLALHSVMFLPALQAQADDEQQEWWLGRAMNLEIIGTYAQTEMGHGTNLRKLETTATYDKLTQEFIINSPTTTSMKWWPGNLGKSSNHAVVTAILFIDGKNYGPQNFFIQLRHEDTHMPKKGITVGDIGPKLEYNATDNGFLRFDHVRIPRRHMLMRHAKVAADGTFSAPPVSKAAYSAMVHVRSHMIAHQGIFLGYALTSAIRYSAIRRQGEITPGQGEVKVLDYQTQQHRLFPQLARALAFMFTGYKTRNIYLEVIQDLKNGKEGDLADLHMITSGLKAVVTHLTGQGIEQARMSCGGHGYSRAANFAAVYGVAIGGCTYEGENMVMLQQMARYLVRAAKSARAGEKSLSPLVEYLFRPTQRQSLIDKQPDPEYRAHLMAFEHIARQQIFHAFDRLESLLKSGLSKEEAWNKNAVELNRASRLHTRMYIAQCFHDYVCHVSDFETRKILMELVRLHLNYELIDMSYYLLQDGYLSGGQLDYMKEDMYRLLEVIRPNAVSIVDSYDFTDLELRSVLGRKDGQVYENLYEFAKNSELNATQVLPTFEKYLKPLMNRGKQMSKI